jgi:hypothetical protein
MNTIPELKPLKKSDYPGLNVLFKKAFGSDRTLETWRWKFDANPHGEAVATVATVLVPNSSDTTEKAFGTSSGRNNTTQYDSMPQTDADDIRIVGFYGLIPRRVTFMSQTMTGWQEVDLMVDPDFAAGGLFKRLGRETYARLCGIDQPFTFGFPNQTSLPAGKRILGWKAIDKIPLWTMILNPADALSGKLPALPGLKSAASSVIRLHNRFRLRSKWRGHIRDETCITDTIADFLAVSSDDADIEFVRDAEYLSWRYDAMPEEQYRMFAAESAGGDIEAAAVIGVSDRERANIAEFRVRKHSEDAGRELLRCIAGYCRETDIATIRAWALNNSPEAFFLKSCGFFDRNALRYHVIRSFRSPEFNRYLWNARRWRLSSGDSDCV